jgi:hypothetical protein
MLLLEEALPGSCGKKKDFILTLSFMLAHTHAILFLSVYMNAVSFTAKLNAVCLVIQMLRIDVKLFKSLLILV